MIRLVFIGFWVGILLCPGTAVAQDDESIEDEFALLEEELAADEVTSASKHRQSIFWSPSAITVLTREDIQASGAINVPDLLRRVPGFDVYEMKPSFPLVGARALTDHSNNLILVLVDGREPLIELTGWPIWAGFTIDLEEIERIEIIRGPGSTLYGANAFAGVVSITTLPDRPSTGADISLSAGEGGTHRLFGRARGSFTLGEGTLDFSAGMGSLGRFSPSDRDDKVMYADVYGHGYLRYRIGQRLDLSLHAGAAYGGGTMYFVMGDFRTSHVLNHFEMAKAEFGLLEGMKLKAQIYHIRFEGDLLYRASVESLGFWLAHIPNVNMDQHTLDSQVQLDYQVTDGLLLTAGGNIRYTTTSESVNITPSDIFELRGAGFLHAQLMLADVFQFTGGLRYDLNTNTEGALSPRAVVVFRPIPDHSFRLGYGLAFRKPSFLEYRIHIVITEAAFPEVVEKFKTAIGNDELVNEKVHSFEAGWRARFLDDTLRISADLFYNIYEDMIYFESELVWDALGPDILASTFEYRNQNELVHAVGGEAAITWESSDAWMFWGNLGLRRVFDEDGERLASEPTLRANLGCRFTSGRGLFADLAVHYVSTYEMPLYHPDETFEDPEDVSLGDAWLVIGRLGYRFEPWQDRSIEAGLTLRVPVGGSFREYPGVPMKNTTRTAYDSDFAGEKLVRLAWFYLRSSF